ncbi:TonB-dependent receptor plug domain-containing protein [Tenacibaculum amylolyticum]|uniref:TonB-dependent receptor plug domain-containing protein n=1 Tax=Tenacibaculum amylolyticum TaxID=104269 RepID=UPI0038B648E7
MRRLIFILLFVSAQIISAQSDTIFNRLNEVVIQANKRLSKTSKAYKLLKINDSVIVNNVESFTSLLRFNTPIYFREFGQGGTSSPSFRGTSASNTAVVWNGININSINNGQTGFNSLTVGLYDELNVRSGGGSIEFGSGAIGGTIHLNDVLTFSEKKKLQHQIFTAVGSFTTINSLYKLKYNSSKYAFNLGFSFNTSDNDYPFINSDFRNANGAYKNYTINLSNAYKFSERLVLDAYMTYYFGDRLFSGELPNPTAANDQYKDINYRNLLSLTYNLNNLKLTGRLAYLFQEYRFFDDKETGSFNFGQSKRAFSDLTADYNFKKLNATLTSNTRFERVKGRTDQILPQYRTEFSQSFIFDHKVKPNFSYDLKIRKEYNSDFKVPLSYAAGFKLKPFYSFFIRANASRNFRVPTYNDLFWPGQGNPNLIPETSFQGELGLGYKSSNVFIDVAYFNIDTKDKIVWTPNGDPNRPGVWVPINLNETLNQGIELTSKISYNFFNDYKMNLRLNYVFVHAKNKNTNRLIPFVPKHIANINLSVSKGKWSMFYQQLFNDQVFTTESNSLDFVVDRFFVSNIGVNYKLINTEKQQLGVGLKVNNLLNSDYEIVQNRPMPGINYNFNLNYKF